MFSSGMSNAKEEDQVETTSSVLEQDTSRSLAATLKLARAKGYIDKQTKRAPTSAISAAKKIRIEAKDYTVDEKRGGDERRDYRSRSGPSNQLREVREPDYKPEINLEYTDDVGRKLDTKEAFRHMCYKFHGKGPGKNKIDKRLKKQELERKMKQALTTDVPESAALMISKQKELKTPHIVLNKGR